MSTEVVLVVANGSAAFRLLSLRAGFAHAHESAPVEVAA